MLKLGATYGPVYAKHVIYEHPGIVLGFFWLTMMSLFCMGGEPSGGIYSF